MSIDKIVAQLSYNMIGKPSLYEVQILGGNSEMPDATPDVMFNCSAVTTAGYAIPFTQDKRTGIGVKQNIPNDKVFSDIMLTFYQSEREMEREYFVKWVNTIYDKDNKRFNFYKNYTKTIIIKQFSRTGELVHEQKLFDCWPTNISPLEKGHGMHDTLPMFTVGISYNEVEEKFYKDDRTFI